MDVATRAVHICRVGDVRRLANSEHFVDDRGVGLRVTWHFDAGLIVVSVWHGRVCAGSFRLPITDAARVVNLLLSSMSEWASYIDGDISASTSVSGD